MALLLLGRGLWRRRRYLLGASVALLLGAALAGWAGWRALRKTHAAVSSALRPRTGQEIYSALLGTPPAGCVQVLHYQDQVVPKIDYAIWLHYRTCPNELRRVLARHPFSQRQLTTANELNFVPYNEDISWFKPAAIGDTIIEYGYAPANGRTSQTLWVSPDSTQVYLRDVAD